MLKATTYLSPSSNLYQQPHTPTVYRKQLVPCTPNANRRSLRVSFPSNLICGPTRKSAALKVCNVLIDRYPVTRGAIDSGATDHFLPTTYHRDNHQATSNGMKVKCANNSIMTSTSTDVLSLAKLPPLARTCHKFDDVSTPLLSVEKLCDNDLHVLFSQNKVTVTDKAPILTGTTAHTLPRVNALQRVNQINPIGNTAGMATAASAYEVQTVAALTNFFHMTLGSPSIPEWINCINNNWFKSWPGLSADRVRKHCTKKEQTTLGNQKMIKKNVRTSNIIDLSVRKERIELKKKLHDIGTFLIDGNDMKQLIAMDLPGRYPVTSARGHKYIMVMYDYDTNYINAVPIKSRKSSELVAAFKFCYDELKERGFTARVLRLDNEISTELIAAIREQNLEYQIVSPGDHRLNHAERAIQTFKSKLIAFREGADPSFPKNCWDLFVTQTVLAMNLMRPSRINPLISAYTLIHGEFDFNRTPMAPVGCKVIVHDRRGERGSWSNHGSHGFYIERAPHHYRNYTCYMRDTKQNRISNTVEFFPSQCSLPKVTPIDRLALVLQDLHQVLSQPPSDFPFLNQGTDLHTAITAIQKILCLQVDDTATKVPTSPVPPPRYTKPTKKALLLLPIRHHVPTNIHIPTAKSQRPKKVQRLNRYNRYPMVQQPQKPNKFSNGYSKAVEHLQPNFAFRASGAVWDDSLNKMAKYRDLINHKDPVIKNRWLQSGENEFARLFQGYGETEEVDVLDWIRKGDVPRNKQVTYPRYVVAVRPEKSEPYRTRITAGGDRIDYKGNVTTHTASMETIKMHWNSVVSTPGAKYCTADISNMYLCSLLPDEEYVRFKYDMIPPNIIKHYSLDKLVVNGFVYAKIKKAWYGLKQSGKIAHDDLVQHLEKYGYVKEKRTDGLFSHKERDINFTLVVDDFGIKYTDKADVEHLVTALRDKYPLKVDWKAEQYIGIHLKWNYIDREVICSMDGYVEQALKEFNHIIPKQLHSGPSKIDRPDYGAKVQYVKEDLTNNLDEDQIKFIQRVTGKFLFYARAIDDTMLHAINDIASSTANGTEATLAATRYFLNYAASNPNGQIIYRASDMILRIDSDAVYLVRPEARSGAGGYHYLGSKDGTLFNGPILVLAKIIKNVMASAAEAEVAGIYLNATEAVSERNCLIDMGHPQPPTPIKTDNTTARGIITGTIKQKRSKAIDMRFYWLKDRFEQKQFDYVWGPGIENLADYPTKHHSGKHHSTVRPIYLYIKNKSPKTIQGCVELLAR
ncbi:hypothetical protein FRACYDRAFT_181335 [Fragilariopsis cylindrus CCMP1102]|uniref:Integrase catalytic domain-containing protein n=1 Tax=Fragilariopsis cylindrus CCMP1102 TaxID=635003 RepID=A0A1E7FQL4_9STRA|nr:hypothetical protein FRACYDRAFT_181335 [Fragilariopsis cylindrus CCMP1102]|eukprot:OEU20461.1 hypothetical protein FRACYDRAFT_181335 [Fragilariopsis cylindrus CCMP1102]